MVFPEISICVHCSAHNPIRNSSCDSCGKALKDIHWYGPRTIDSDFVARTSAGQSLVAWEKKRHKFAAPIAMAIFGAMMCAYAVRQYLQIYQWFSRFESMLLGAAGLLTILLGLFARTRRETAIRLAGFVWVATNMGMVGYYIAQDPSVRNAPWPARYMGLCMMAVLFLGIVFYMVFESFKDWRSGRR